MSTLRHWIDLVEGPVVNLADFRPEPTNMTPDVRVGAFTIHAARKSPDSVRAMDYWVWIEGPGRDDDPWADAIDIRRYARGAEPEKILGLPDLSGGDDPTRTFADFAKRAETLADYGQDKPPETRFNPAWVLWRKTAILAMAKSYGLTENMTEATGDARWAYHGTLAENISSIESYGLQSNRRAKWSWDDSSKRQFHLLYFSLKGPAGWGVQKDHNASPEEIVELRFPLSSLKRVRWQEDDERPQRDEYFAQSRREFSIPPQAIELLHKGTWIPLLEYWRVDFDEPAE